MTPEGSNAMGAVGRWWERVGAVHPNFESEGRGFESLRAHHTKPPKRGLSVLWRFGLSV